MSAEEERKPRNQCLAIAVALAVIYGGRRRELWKPTRDIPMIKCQNNRNTMDSGKGEAICYHGSKGEEHQFTY